MEPDVKTDVSGVLSSASTKKMLESAEQASRMFSRQLNEEVEELKKEDEAVKAKEKKYHNSYVTVIENVCMYLLLILSSVLVLYYTFRICQAFFTTNSDYASPSFLCVGILALDLIVVIISSAWPYWNFWHRKKYQMFIVCSLSVICFSQFLYYMVSTVIVPFLLMPEPNKWVTKDMWMFLIRFLTIVPTLFGSIGFGSFMFSTVFNRFAIETITGFRLMNHIDLRKGKKYLYDATVVWKLSNGRRYRIREKDRYTHSLINGSTGTAKTSSIIVPMINGDLLKRCLNMDTLKTKLFELVKNGDADVIRKVDEKKFDGSEIAGKTPKIQKEIDRLRKLHPACGITVIAPDASLTDSVFGLCRSKNIDCNRVDPMPDEKSPIGKNKEGFIGFNPLFISPNIPSWKRPQEVVKRATLFADVMQSIHELKGKGDPFFTSINRTVTVSFSICLIVAYPEIEGRQPNPADVQDVVNNFSRIKKYYEVLVKVNNALKQDETIGNIYGFACDFIKLDILGAGSADMFDHSRGLRMMMNEFLGNPLIRRVLCVPEDRTVDLDQMLKQGQITVLNYALELGETDSKGFGLFFLLSFIDAVFRRPSAEGAATNPHFLIIDELPVIIHPMFERAISLFRKYKVAIVGALQSLDQMEKNNDTKYLKGTLMGGCAHHFVFGRCGTDEMKRYSDLCGKEYVEVETHTQSETALTADDPNISFSTRNELKQEEVLAGSSMRNLQFQEITLFTVVNANIVPPFFGKVNFLPESAKNKIERPTFDWDRYLISSDGQPDINEEDVNEALEEMSSNSDDDEDDENLFIRSTSVGIGGGSGTESDDDEYIPATAHEENADDVNDDDVLISSGSHPAYDDHSQATVVASYDEDGDGGVSV